MMLSPQRQASTLHEINYNSPAHLLSLLNGENEDFCSKSNLEESLRYLDKELQMLGLQTLFNGHGTFDLIKLVNVAHKLLRKYQQSSRYKEELEARVQRSAADLEHSQTTQKRLRQTNRSLQNTVSRHEETERQMQLERSNLQLKLKLQQDEVRKLSSLLQSSDNQHKHEIKKKERQLTVLKEKAQQLLTDKNRSTSSIEISRCLTRQDGRRKQWRSEVSSNRSEEDMYRSVMSNFEKRCSSLQSENNSLRELLADVQQELLELSAAGSLSSPRKSNTKEHLQLPVEMIHKRLSESIMQACTKLRTSINSNCADENGLNSTFSVATETEPEPKISHMSADVTLSILEEQEELTKERSVFYKQKAKFEQDKLNLTESTLKLHRERKKFEELKRGLTPTPAGDAIVELSPRANKSPGRSHREQEHINQIKLAVKQSTSSTNNAV